MIDKTQIINGLLAEYKQFQVDKDALKTERDKLDQEIQTFTFQSESLQYKRFQDDRETLKAEREKLAHETHSFKLQSESLKHKEEKSEQDKRKLQIENEGLRKRQSQLQVLEPKNRELEHVTRKLQFEIEESRKQESELQRKVNFFEPRVAELELERSKLHLEIARLGRRNPTEGIDGDWDGMGLLSSIIYTEFWESDKMRELVVRKYHGIRRKDFYLSDKCMEHLVSLNGTYSIAVPRGATKVYKKWNLSSSTVPGYFSPILTC